MARPSGHTPSIAGGHDLRPNLNRHIGTANAQDKAWGYGQPRDGATVGKNNAVWARVLLPGADGILDIPHALGQVPVTCELKFVEAPPGVTPVHASAQPINPTNWTATLCQVHIHLITAAVANCTGVFIVKGE